MTGLRTSDVGRIALVGMLLLVLEGFTLLGARARVEIGVYGAVLLLALLYAARSLRRFPSPYLLAATFALSLALVSGAAAFDQVDRGLALYEELLPTLAGWTALFLLLKPGREEVPAPATERWEVRRSHAAAFLIGTFVLLALAHARGVGRWAIVSDEAVYVVQSRWIDLPQLAWQMDPSLAGFFLMRKIGFLGDHMFGMYPPGWPALLALFRSIGLQWWSSVILGTLSVWLVYRIAARLHGARAGAIAAVLLATSQFYLVAHAGYMAHAAAICAILAATLCLLVGIDRPGRTRLLSWLAAGVLLGYVVTVRPLTGVTLGASIGLWMLLRLSRSTPQLIPRLALLVALGACLPLALFLWHNLIVLGKPLALGYSVLHGDLYDLGFGERGFKVLDANLNWVPASGPFTPRHATRYLLGRLAGLNTTFVPIGMLLPIAATAIAYGYRVRWAVVASFALLPAAHFFYWYGGLRLYTELLPFILIGAAGMLVAIHAKRPRLAGGLLAVLLVSQAILALPWPPGSGGGHRPWHEGVGDHRYGGGAPGRFATFYKADSLAKEHGKILLFTREATKYDNLMDRLYWFNGDRFDGPVLVARDRGALNAQLMRRFPERVPFLVVDRGRSVRADFTRLSPP